MKETNKSWNRIEIITEKRIEQTKIIIDFEISTFAFIQSRVGGL